MPRPKKDPDGSATFKVPLYGGRVLVCCTRDIYSLALESLDGDPDPCLKEYSGVMQEMAEGRKTVRKVWLIGWFDKNLGTLIHELSHTTFRVLRYAQVGISQTNDEAYAYLMDALFTGALKAARRVDQKAPCAIPEN
jgi:hypothetical protein